MRLGQEHEERHLAQFSNPLDLSSLPIPERTERTRQAIAAGKPIVYQGAFLKEAELGGTPVEIVGVPDFLLHAESG